MSKQPKWQRARRIQAIADPFTIGALLWVLTGGVVKELSYEVGTTKVDGPNRLLLSNLIAKNMNMGLVPEQWELLPEFADDVPLIPWEQFLAECRAKKAAEMRSGNDE